MASSQTLDKLGAAALITPGLATGGMAMADKPLSEPGLSTAANQDAVEHAHNPRGDDLTRTAYASVVQQGGEGGGEGGEGGEGGGEGGESGVDPVAAQHDPVVYLTALDVIRAHYLAGLAAYRAEDHQAGAEMFVHPISEVYYDLEAAFKAQGVDPFVEAMFKAGDLAFAGKPTQKVEAAVKTVLAATDAAAKKAPRANHSTAAIEAAVIADMVDRAALQYRLVAAGDNKDAWLDGYGYLKAAQRRADLIREQLDPRFRDALDETLALFSSAYPESLKPADKALDPGLLLAKAGRVSLLASGLQ